MKIEKDDTNYVKSEGMILELFPQQAIQLMKRSGHTI